MEYCLSGIGGVGKSELAIKYLARHDSLASFVQIVEFPRRPPKQSIALYKEEKTKRGVSGFANGIRVSALPDTGAQDNFVSASFAKDKMLEVKPSSKSFKLGNYMEISSVGKQASSLLRFTCFRF